MTGPHSETPNHGGTDRRDETDALSSVKQALSTVTAGRNESGSMLAGSMLLALAARTARRNRRRAVVPLLVGAVLLAYGLRQRWAGRRSLVDQSQAGTGGGAKVSDEAHAARERNDVMHQSDTNPRGTSGDPDVEPAAQPDEGEWQFSETADAEPGSEPPLEETSGDPRADDTEGADIDLSEAAMADEASEATGPDPEQAQPTQTEDTEPEPSPPEDASHMEADVPTGRDEAADPDASDGDDAEPPSEETDAVEDGTRE